MTYKKTYEKLFCSVIMADGEISQDKLEALTLDEARGIIRHAAEALKRRSDRRAEAMAKRTLSETHKARIAASMKGNNNRKK